MFKQFELNSLSNLPDFAYSNVAATLEKLPLGYVDIGARGGAHDTVFGIARHTGVLGFEPDIDECQLLLSNDRIVSPWALFQLESLALFSSAGEFDLHLLSDPNNHSLLPPNTDLLKRYNMVKWVEVGSQKLNTVTLDSVLFGNRAHQEQWGEFIKIDTQGTEFDILEGGSRVLEERCVAAVIEVSFCELYKNQKLFSEVEKFMRKFGFSFYGFMPIHGRSCKIFDKKNHITAERALYSDAIFFKDPLGRGNQKNFTLSVRQIHILFTVALLLNFYDFAIELARKTWLQEADAHENNLIEKLVSNLSELPTMESVKAVDQLANNVKKRPELANLFVHEFVDRRRKICDFDDILNVSPLPRAL